MALGGIFAVSDKKYRFKPIAQVIA
jgi:hypothetical protein